jgi:hypothetical protein
MGLSVPKWFPKGLGPTFESHSEADPETSLSDSESESEVWLELLRFELDLEWRELDSEIWVS